MKTFAEIQKGDTIYCYNTQDNKIENHLVYATSSDKYTKHIGLDYGITTDKICFFIKNKEMEINGVIDIQLSTIFDEYIVYSTDYDTLVKHNLEALNKKRQDVLEKIQDLQDELCNIDSQISQQIC